MLTIKIAWDVQNALSEAQTNPIGGPFLISPIKAVLSLAELIAGFAIFVLFGTLTIVAHNKILGAITAEAALHTGLGLIHFAYSLSNIISLGVVGCFIEDLTNKIPKPYI